MMQQTRPVLLVLASTYPRWAHDHEPGFVHELAKRLTDGFRVLALVPHAAGALDRETLDGVEVIRYRYAPVGWETLVNDGGIVTNLRRSKWKAILVPTFVFMQAWQAWRLLRTEKVDVIHAHWLMPQGVVAALLRSLPGRKPPFVVTSHGADLYAIKSRWLQGVKRFVARQAATVTVVSGAMRDMLSRIGVPVEKVRVLPMGVDMSGRFVPDDSERRAGEILFVGRLVEKKGLGHLINAMPEILRRQPQASLTVAGFGPEEGALKTQVRVMGLEQSVRFLGAVAQERLPTLYRRASLFVAPFVRARSGDQEGLGLVVVEAIGCGCPILVGRVPAVADVLGDGFDDMTVDPSHTEHLVARIVEVLTNQDVARVCAFQLRETMGKRFDWSSVAAAYARLLQATHHAESVQRPR